MKINVCYTVTKNVNLEVSDEFKELENMDWSPKDKAWSRLALALEDTILQMIPETDVEVLGVLDTDTQEIVYEN